MPTDGVTLFVLLYESGVRVPAFLNAYSIPLPLAITSILALLPQADCCVVFTLKFNDGYIMIFDTALQPYWSVTVTL